MDADSDQEADFQARSPRRHESSSSRESSPALKRPRRSFTPLSDDGDAVIQAAHHDAETPTTEHPLIRQAVGFSWTFSTDANPAISTYQACVPTQPSVAHFLPGQAPPAPPKPKVTKPRAPRQKKGALYSEQTGRFKLSNSTLSLSPPTPGSPSVLTSTASANSSSGPASSTATSRPMASNRASGARAAAASNGNGDTFSVIQLAGTKRPRKAPKKKANDSGQPGAAPPAQHDGGAPSGERPGPTDVHMAYASVGTPSEQSNASTSANQGASQNASRPLRMVTLLIEDIRSGVPDAQLAEVKVPLRSAEDPEDGFWADAIDICNALQSGPSRIDGPAKVYTMRGRFRQFFLRVDESDHFVAQSAHLGVTKDRTINVFVEAPVPQGQLPRPPAPSEPRHAYNSGSERDSPSGCRPTYSLLTREDQMERLSRSSYAQANRRRPSPVSESGSYGHSQRTASPNARQRARYHSPGRPLTPPIPGRLADTQEEVDEAIANYIRSHVENDPGWMEYMQSKAKPQRVCEVLKQYAFVEDRVRELSGLNTPAHWDGAPNCQVNKYHVWRVLKVDDKWGNDCEETLDLVAYYGPKGTRYEDSRVVDMMNDTTPPSPNTSGKFLQFLRTINDHFAEDVIHGRTTFMLRPVRD